MNRETRSGSQSNALISEIKAMIEASKDEVITSLTKEIKSLKDEITSLTKRVDTLEQQNKIIKDSNSRIVNELENNFASKSSVLELTKVIEAQCNAIENHERLLRKKNLIIHGVTESSNDPVPKRTISRIMEFLGVDLNTDTDCESVQRLGKPVSGRCRPLRLVLKDFELKSQILSKAKSLRSSQGFSNVYVNSDLTPLQQSFNKHLRTIRDELS